MADTDISLSVDLDVQDAEKTAEDLQKEIQNIFAKHPGEQTVAFTRLEMQMKKNYEAAEELRLKMIELGKDGPSPEYQKLTADIKAAEDEFVKLGDTIYYQLGIRSEEQLQPILEELQLFKDYLKDFPNEGTIQLKNGAIMSRAEIESWISETEHSINAYYKMTERQKELNAELEKMNELRSQMEAKGLDYIVGKETVAYQEAEKALDGLNDKMKQNILQANAMDLQEQNKLQIAQQQELKQQAEEARQAQQEARMETIAANSSLMAVNMAIRSIGRIIPGVSTTAISGVVMLTRSILRLTKLTKAEVLLAIGKIKAAFASLFAFIMAHPLVLVITALLALIVVLVKKVSELHKKVEEFVDDLIDKLGDIVTFIKDKALDGIRDLAEGFIKLGMALPKTLIKLVSTLIDKIKSLKSVIQENLDLMTQWNGGNNDVNKSLSDITSSLSYLKVALATAVAPVLNYVAPVISFITDKIADLITLIGMLIAKITGATTFQKAIRVQKNYADSLDKTGKSAENASRGLASFDKLNVLNKEGGSGSSNLEDSFELFKLEDVEIPSWLENLGLLGEKVGKAIKEFLEGIDWEGIKEKASTIGKDIAEFFNGFFSIPDIGTTIGNTLGEGLNTITSLVLGFIDNLKEQQIGQQLGDALMGFVHTTDWKNVGKIFSGAMNKLAGIIKGFTDRIDGEKIGEAITEILQNALGGLNWPLITQAVEGIADDLVGILNKTLTPDNMELVGTTLANTLNTIFRGIDVFVQKAEWEQWGQSIANGIMAFFETADFKATALTITHLVNGFLDMLLKAITYLADPVNMKTIITKIKDFFENIPWREISEKAVAISTQLREVLSAIWQALKDSGAYDEIIKFISDFLSEKENWEKLFEGFKDDVVGDVFWEQIKGIFVQVGKHIANAINTLIEFIADSFNNIGNFLGALNPLSDTTWEDYLNGKKTSTSYSSGSITRVTPPGLAQGAVLPPNKPFMAIVGDQKSGTNVEAPLSTIQQAVTDVMKNIEIKAIFDVQGDPYRIFKVVQRESIIQNKKTANIVIS